MPTRKQLDLCVIFLFELFFIDFFYHFGNAIIILIMQFGEERITQD